jgi:hypothetical protein
MHVHSETQAQSRRVKKLTFFFFNFFVIAFYAQGKFLPLPGTQTFKVDITF